MAFALCGTKCSPSLPTTKLRRDTEEKIRAEVGTEKSPVGREGEVTRSGGREEEVTRR